MMIITAIATNIIINFNLLFDFVDPSSLMFSEGITKYPLGNIPNNTFNGFTSFGLMRFTPL